MRITSVTAHAFGPLAGDRLDLAEGMTVVVGDNESGKSSWHAAIYAALCGRKRGRGAATITDRQFESRHHPWSGTEWLVSAQLTLDDGRRIEMRQDLEGKVDCSATDLATGRDVSTEIVFEGAPDASRWLGLDRTSFLATACVGQASLLDVRESAAGLQEYLQRAATSATAESTAAGAISLLRSYHREQVGLDRANAVKPLRKALDAQAVAERELVKTNADHREYLTRVERAEVAGIARATAERELRACEAVVAADEAERLSAAARRAAELDSACGGAAPPVRAEDDALDEQVLRALADYDGRPAEPAAVSPTVAELDAELADLPPAPEGDLTPDASVITAVDGLRRSQMAFDAHAANQPAAPVGSLPAATERELLELAHTLSSPPPEVDGDLVGRLTRAQADAAPPSGGRRTPVLVVGAALAALGVALLVLGQRAAGAVLVLGGAVAVGVGLVSRRSQPSQAAIAELARAEAALHSAEAAAGDARRSHDAAVARCKELGVRPAAQALRDLAVGVANAADLRRRADEFAARSSELAADVERSAASLRGALAARGCDVRADIVDPAALIAAEEAYARACQERAVVAGQAAGRATLVARRDAALQAEARAAADRAARARAASALIAAAASTCSLTTDDELAARDALDGWQRERAAARSAADVVRQQWAELQALLGGRAVADLQADADRARQRLELLTGDTADTGDVDPAQAAERLSALRAAAEQARHDATRAATEATEFAQHIGSVAEAEEAVAAADAEVERVRRLDRTLSMTQQFLEAAEAEVHRSIAPLLNASLNQHLPAITAGRYTEALVDPDSLSVKVCGSSRSWRSAEQLSFGTTEQIYLLLRSALADQLTTGHDTCPLILDDVTVHADARRKPVILELLHELSKQRQVIMFTQEEQVAEWADEHLTGPQDAIRRLSPIPVA